MRLFFIAILATLSTSAVAQQNCGDREGLVKALADKYQESRVSQGISIGGNLVEVFASIKGTWTIIVSPPNSPIACIVQTGTDWDKLPGRDASL